MSSRIYNFSPGPAAIPLEVMQLAQNELLNWHDIGYSVLEMGHRSPEFTQILQDAISKCRQLLRIPADYHVIFMQSGAIGQNAIIPLNLSQGHEVDFILSGYWSQNSYTEAQKYCTPQIVANSASNSFQSWPTMDISKLNPKAQYLHLCDNETLLGVENHQSDFECLGSVPLVLDMTSNIMTRPIANWSNIGMIFASAQKNLGMAGVTMVIVKDQLLGKTLSICPSAFDYTKIVEYNSCYNTPPTFAIYLAGLVMEWILQQTEGEFAGVEAMHQRSLIKSHKLYKFIDESSIYQAMVTEPNSRSRVNVSFRLVDESLNELFLHNAKNAGLVNLQGHHKIGGMRASLYNAMPIDGVLKLINFMEDFQKENLKRLP